MMKDDDAPRPVAEIEPPPTPTGPRVDEDPTILARWLYRGMEQGLVFWVILGGLAVGLLGLGVVVSSLSAAKSVTSQAWIDLVPATTAEDQLKVADANPKTPVADWARLQAAYEEYRAGLDDLITPDKRESAGPRLKRALDLFSQVAREAPKDTPQARGAAFAVARVLETRNELPEAIKQYQLVAETWKDSPEARRALTLAKRLEDPGSVQFYKELYASKSPSGGAAAGGIPGLPPPPPVTLPGGKPMDLIAPGTSGAGKSFLPDFSGPAGLDPPPVKIIPGPTTPTTPPTSAALPAESSPEIVPAPATIPEAQPAPVETPAPATTPALPADPIAIPAPQPTPTPAPESGPVVVPNAEKPSTTPKP